MDSPAVQRMAERIAKDGAQTFNQEVEFKCKYGDQAVDMFKEGGLIAALFERGINASPVQFKGASSTAPTGIKLTLRSG